MRSPYHSRIKGNFCTEGKEIYSANQMGILPRNGKGKSLTDSDKRCS